MDHHHWNHSKPINLAERKKWYARILYQLNGFMRGERDLKIIHRSMQSHQLESARQASYWTENSTMGQAWRVLPNFFNYQWELYTF